MSGLPQLSLLLMVLVEVVSCHAGCLPQTFVMLEASCYCLIQALVTTKAQIRGHEPLLMRLPVL